MAAQKALKLTDPLRYTLPAEGSFAATKRASEQPYTFAMPAQVVPEQISAASATAGALALQRAITGYEILNV
jgi:hypothetical protein